MSLTTALMEPQGAQVYLPLKSSSTIQQPFSVFEPQDSSNISQLKGPDQPKFKPEGLRDMFGSIDYVSPSMPVCLAGVSSMLWKTTMLLLRCVLKNAAQH